MLKGSGCRIGARIRGQLHVLKANVNLLLLTRVVPQSEKTRREKVWGILSGCRRLHDGWS